MTELLTFLLLIAALIGGSIGYRVGWNAKVSLDRQRTIEAAKKKADADKL
jgi:hypothetical protein